MSQIVDMRWLGRQERARSTSSGPISMRQNYQLSIDRYGASNQLLDAMRLKLAMPIREMLKIITKIVRKETRWQENDKTERQKEILFGNKRQVRYAK